MSRLYPALNVLWPLRPDDDRIDLLIAEVDDERPTAVEEIHNGLRIFFPTPLALGRAAVRLVALEPDLACEPVEISDDDWAERSQMSLGPVRVGRIVVSPPWAENNAEENTSGVFLIIQPSMGFGTGHHASTRLCLQLLQEFPLSDATVLDVGTGSGVLAIAAAKLGAAHVLAIDHDADALTSARENVDLNAVAETVALAQVDLGDQSAALEQSPLISRAGFDVVLANLTGAALSRHARRLAELVRANGRLVVSGLGHEEERQVVDAFAAVGLAPVSRAEEDEWIAASLRAPSP